MGIKLSPSGTKPQTDYSTEEETRKKIRMLLATAYLY
ncbi:hypothetical protein T01_1458 [Trichinella spiralis]|uniref:Uncharacterized protein n=1 Tax=Trichinella spiralis TaxID=6334 RepID=A0A0V1AIP4_TRISP|nr:hypothetical protein T01_1458 [Trichinella spiralis]